MLCWLMAVLLGIGLSISSFLESLFLSRIFSWAVLAGIILQAVGFGLLVLIFPYFINAIGTQWATASRTRVKLILVAFTIACRLRRQPDPTPPAASL